MLQYQTLLIEIEEGIGWLTLNRPSKKNAMNPRLHLDMASALEYLHSTGRVDATRSAVMGGSSRSPSSRPDSVA